MGTITCSRPEANFDSVTKRIYLYDSTAGTYTLTDTNSFDLFSDSAVIGDAIIFRIRYDQFFPSALKFNIGTAMAGTGIGLKWYFGSTNNKVYPGYSEIDWLDVTNDVTDNTNSFTTLGINNVEFPKHKDIIFGKFTPIDSNSRDMWIKVEIDNLTTITEGGAITTDKVKQITNEIRVTGSHINSTLTSNGVNQYFNDTTQSFTDDDSYNRAVFFPQTNQKWNKFPLRQTANSTRLYMGISATYGSTSYHYFEPGFVPQTGDRYAISYNMEDLRNACVTAGYDWIIGFGYRPQHQHYTGYEINCNIVIDSQNTEDTFISGFSQRFMFFAQYGFTMVSSRTIGQYMFGARASGYKLGVAHYTQLDNVPNHGCTIDHMSNGVNGRTFVLSGEFAGCTFTNGTRYSFVTYWNVAYCNFYNCIFENCQLSSGYSCEGELLIHSPVAEPLRNPASTFNVKQFRANAAVIYITGGLSAELDTPASGDLRPFRTYAGFVSPYIGKIIDKDEYTRFDISWGAFVDPTGTFEFWFRTSFNLIDEDNNPLENVSIKIYNNNGDLVVDELTDASGQVGNDGTIMVKEREGIHDSTSTSSAVTDWIYYNDFRVVISKQGYETLDYEATISKKINETVMLKKAIDTMVLLGKGIVIRADPTNSTKDRDLLI